MMDIQKLIDEISAATETRRTQDLQMVKIKWIAGHLADCADSWIQMKHLGTAEQAAHVAGQIYMAVDRLLLAEFGGSE